MDFHFDPRLTEDALSAALARQPMLALRYRAEVEQVYDDVPLDEREAAFARLHAAWFQSLALDRPLRAIFDEFPLVVTATSQVLVGRADRAPDEGAVLARRSMCVGLRLLPRRWVDQESLSRLMRHELMHVIDMLHPAFGYPDHPPNGATAGANLIRDRYRLLWDLSVDGRLAQAKRKSVANAAVRRNELDTVYRSLPGAARSAIFERLWGATDLTHDHLWTMASDVRVLLAFAGVPGAPGTSSGPLPGARCPLCRFPTYDWSPPLAPHVVSVLQADFPNWRPEDGVCDRCAELYRWRLETLASAAQRSGVGDW